MPNQPDAAHTFPNDKALVIPNDAAAAEEPVPSEEQHETWLDWLPPGWHQKGMPEPPFISRAEMLEELQKSGYDVGERTLRSWETAGVLPRPVRRAHGGAAPAVYPEWQIRLVAEVYRLRHLPRAERPRLAALAPPMHALFRAYALASLPARGYEWRLDEPTAGQPALPSALVKDIFRFMHGLDRTETGGRRAAGVEFRVLDERGDEIAGYTLLSHALGPNDDDRRATFIETAVHVDT